MGMSRTIVWLRTFWGCIIKTVRAEGSVAGLAYLMEIHRRAWPGTRTRRTRAVMDKGSKHLGIFETILVSIESMTVPANYVVNVLGQG